MSKLGKAICQYCNRPTPDEDLVKSMCSLCRAYYGHISDVKLKKSRLKQLHALLLKEIDWLVNRIAENQSLKSNPAREFCLRDYREILAEKQGQLLRARQELGRAIEVSGQDVKNDRIMRKSTQQQYADLLGVTKRHLRRIERGLAGINDKILRRFENVRF